jgi:predicted adenine nucleotide alpha hydrolase (AANH) superfamily ATPase
MIGLWTFYYYDQNVKIEYNYSKNKQTNEKYLKLNGELYSGEFIYYDNENGVKEERKIKDGLRNGKTIYIDIKTKKTINKENYKNGELK